VKTKSQTLSSFDHLPVPAQAYHQGIPVGARATKNAEIILFNALAKGGKSYLTRTYARYQYMKRAIV
jgi:hypothetical protein